jgi:hypothetical protein
VKGRAVREGKARTSERKRSATFTPTEGRRVFFAEGVVVRQNQPIQSDGLVFNQGFCLGLRFAGVYDLLGADEDAVG